MTKNIKNEHHIVFNNQDWPDHNHQMQFQHIKELQKDMQMLVPDISLKFYEKNSKKKNNSFNLSMINTRL